MLFVARWLCAIWRAIRRLSRSYSRLYDRDGALGAVVRWGELAVTLLVIVFTTVFATYTFMKPAPQPPIVYYDSWKPKSDQELALRKLLRPADISEIRALELAEITRGAYAQPKHFYIAIADITLPDMPTAERMVIGLPPGIKWVAGPRTNIFLVAANADRQDARNPAMRFALGRFYSDPLCRESWQTRVNMMTPTACAEGARVIPTRDEMMTHLKPVSTDEARELTDFWALPTPANPFMPYYGHKVTFYVTTGNLRLWPGVEGEYLVIIRLPEHKIEGGRVGNLVVVDANSTGSRQALYEDLGWDGCASLGPKAKELVTPSCS